MHILQGAGKEETVESILKFKSGDTGVVSGYASGAGAWKSRLLAMGMTVGTGFTVTNVAPLGDPVEITVRGSRLTLRKGEAQALLVEHRGNKEDHHE